MEKIQFRISSLESFLTAHAGLLVKGEDAGYEGGKITKERKSTDKIKKIQVDYK